MDFFEAQAHAKKRTSRLVWLFAISVAGTIALAYFAAVIGLNFAQGSRPYSPRYNRRTYDNRYAAPMPETTLWQPRVLAAVSVGTLLVVGLASLYKWNEYSSGGSAVAESVGGRRVDPHTTDAQERRLLNVVEEMAIASGVPVPAVWLMEDEPAINAFAAGLTTSDAAVCVTRGTMEKLTREELQGVIGHEFSHILNGDMRLNLRIGATVFGILVIGLAGRGILWSLRGMRFRGKNSGGVLVAIVFVGVALLVIGYIGYFFGRLIQAAVSRQREFLADASSVQFTRNPVGITGALKKIGGYALGSSLETHKAAEIGHFFFAQGFTSAFDAVWATHPPLAERIRAIDPQFDGQMFTPPEVVDVQHESFVTAGLAPAKPALRDFSSRTAQPLAAIASIGTLTSDQIQNAAAMIDSVPAELRTATQSPNTAAVLVCGLLLDDRAEIRARQYDLVTQHAGDDARRVLESLDAPLRSVRPEQKLPLLQLALPAVRQLDQTDLDPVIATLNALILADGQVSPFEFALEKIFTRSLELGRSPGRATAQFYSFNALTAEISVVLSALAHVSSNVDLDARTAFAAGAAQIKLIEAQLAYLDETACNLTRLDAALDKLAVASLPIKQRTLVAAAHVVGADGKILIAEAELLRAISATLDVPMPPLAAAA
jgi:Zn-dependent protease with chaperone function